MTAQLITEAGNPIPPEIMLDWCKIWGDADRRLRCDEITLHVLGGAIFRVQGQLWERLAERRGEDYLAYRLIELMKHPLEGNR